MNWNEIKWIFEPDGTLRDIYIKNVNIDIWIKLISYLNQKFDIKYGSNGANKIDLEYVTESLTNHDEKRERYSASIIIDNIIINTHFFFDQEIEFDLDPKEINSKSNFEKVLNFMTNISKILNREVILTGENQIEFPLITIDYCKQIRKALIKS